MKKRILALSLSTVMALSALAGVLIAHKMTIGPAVEETAMVVDEEPSRAVLAANYTQEDLDRVAKEALDIINNIRKENGRSPLKWGGNFISDIRAEEITEVFSHYSESIPTNKMSAENCARTNSLNAQHVVDLWMNSAGHRNNILFNIPTHAQISVVEKNGRYYWVNCFFGPESYEDRLAEYESGMYRHREETETATQPSSVSAEVKQEEQKPSTAQEVNQEVNPEVKSETKQEEQKPSTTAEVKQSETKQEEQTPASSSKAEGPYNLDKATGQKLSEEEQRALAEKYPDEVEKNPEKKQDNQTLPSESEPDNDYYNSEEFHEAQRREAYRELTKEEKAANRAKNRKEYEEEQAYLASLSEEERQENRAEEARLKEEADEETRQAIANWSEERKAAWREQVIQDMAKDGYHLVEETELTMKFQWGIRGVYQKINKYGW